ncbi:hypothetical protein D3C71_1022250 [compost metagenome]
MRATFHQRLDHRQVTLERGAGNRALAIVVADFRIGLVFKQDFHGVHVAVVSGQHQQGVALVIAQVRRQAFAQQRSHHGRIALACLVENLFGKFGSFFGGHLAAFVGHWALHFLSFVKADSFPSGSGTVTCFF